jgi:3-hydroxyisobutyrate dehydrogenase-like beta-hydroxyacid dehydrogenase
MGHALAAAFVAADHPTTVWNRTPGRAGDLDVVVADTAVDAMAASPLVVVSLLDYEVAESVLDADALKGRTLANLSGGSPEQARAMAAWAAEHGIEYLDGVIVATPTAVGTAEATLYFSGPAAAYQSHRSTLSALGENAHYLGEDPGRAAGFDASLQDLFWTSMSGVVHMFALAKAQHIAPTEIAGHAKSMLALFPDLIDLVAEQVATDHFPGDLAQLTSVAATLDHILSTIRSSDLDNGVLTAVRAEVQQAIDNGHGSEGFARLAAR